jgi:hypothetical protein
MKRAVFVAISGFLVLVWASPGEAQIPARGLSALVCLAGIGTQEDGVYEVSGQLTVVVSGDSVDNDGNGSATIHVIHGGDDSTHVVTYLDLNNTEQLDCGDLIQTVS